MPDLVFAFLPQSGTPYFAVFGAGFAIGVLGHMAGSRNLVAVGVALVAIAAFFLLLAFNLTDNTPPEIEKRALSRSKRAAAAQGLRSRFVPRRSAMRNR